MASILKVDQIQLPDGSAPTASDLGVDITTADMPAGSVLQVVTWSLPDASVPYQTTSTAWLDTGWGVTITPKKADSTLLIVHSNSMVHAQSGAWIKGTIVVNGVYVGGQYQTGYQDDQSPYAPWISQTVYQPSDNTTPLTIRLHVATNGSNARYLHANSSAAMTVYEIAQ